MPAAFEVWDKAMSRRRELRRGRCMLSTGDGVGGPIVAAAGFGVGEGEVKICC